LKRGESSIAYNSYYMISLSYDTVVTSLNVKECEEIQRPVINVILPKNGSKQKHDKERGVRDKYVWRVRFGPPGRFTRICTTTILDQ
jgi:hypothetical protein